MNYIKSFFNFDDIGNKIKTWTQWACWISILIVWIVAAIYSLVCLFTRGMFQYALLAPLAALLYSVLIWIGSWTMYALGQYVEDIHAIRNKEVPPVEYKTTSTILPPPKDIFAKNKTEDGDNKVKRCPYCGDIVKRGRCEMCGKEV